MMFSSIDESYPVYVQALRIYKTWLDERRAAYGHLRYMEWDNRDYQDIQTRNAALLAMESVLGLTAQEVIDAGHSVGIKTAAELRLEELDVVI